MIESLANIVASLTQRLQRLEQLPFNPYSPDADLFDHFAGDGTLRDWWNTTIGGVTANISLPNTTPSVCRLTTGGDASSTSAINWGTRFPLVGVNKWCDMRGRFAVTTAVDADDVITMRLQAATPDIIEIGVRGATSTAFFECRSTSGGLANVQSTVTTFAIDTAYHDWRIQTFPDRIRFYIDNALVAEHAQFFTTAALNPRFDCNNGANGGTRTMDVDLVWVRENR